MLPIELTNEEYFALNMFFDFFPQWKNVICAQIHASSLERERTFSDTSISFDAKGKVDAINTTSKMPIEIILGKVTLPKNCITNTINGFCSITPCTITVLDETAIGIRLYFNNGVINELEMYNLSGMALTLHGIEKKERVYIVHDRAMFFQ